MESVLGEICQESGVGEGQWHQIKTETLVKESKITRNKLAHCLQTMTDLLYMRASPLLEKGSFLFWTGTI